MGAAAAPPTTPTFPVPASTRAQPTTGAARPGTTTPAGVAAAGGTAGTPPSSGTGTGTTTYVPSGGTTPAPSAVPNGTASTIPTVSSAPTVGAGSLAPGHASPGQPALPSGGRTAARPSKKHLSAAAIAIAAIAALLALGCAVWGLARRRAFEPHWWLSLRHAMAEAGFRASATWAEFTDWVRLGH